jgi:hypothetical protein
MTLARRSAEGDALQTGRYLDSLLAADREAIDVPADASLDPTIRDTARRLRRQLVPVHPSFRFEERLAARLAEVARSMRLPQAAGAGGAPITAGPAERADELELLDDLLEGPALNRARPLLIGGALTSAALSIAGAAFVAWRRTRTTRRVPAAHARLD